MALTRKALKAMGLTEEQVESIIEAHAETVDGLMNELKTAKASAEKLETVKEELSAVKKELNELKAAGDGGFEKKYNDIKAEYEKYKGDVTAKEEKAAKEAAARAYFEGKNITGKNLEIAMRGARDEIGAIKLKDGAIVDTKALDALVEGDYAGLVVTTSKAGANTATPPSGKGSAISREDIYKRDASGRFVYDAPKRQEMLSQIINNEQKG